MGYNNADLIFSNLAKGKYTVKDIIVKYDLEIDEEKLDIDYDNDSLTQKFLRRARGIAKGVKVGGIDNTMVTFPRCCNPIPGDEIVGYITRGRGVTLHRLSCKNLPIKQNRDRVINVEWDVNNLTPYLVRLKIMFQDRKDLLKDLTESTSIMNINIKSVDIKAEQGIATCLMIVEVKDVKELKLLNKKIISTINPISIERV